MASPSMLRLPSEAQASCRVWQVDSTRACLKPQWIEAMAISHARGRGKSEASAEKAPRTPSPRSAIASQRDGRHSNR